MKRWQDRGEVQDSDDEEVGFSNESQSSERPGKRQKLSNQHTSSHEPQPLPQGICLDDEDNTDEEAWLQPKPMATYGRKAALRRPRPPLGEDALSHEQGVSDLPAETAVDAVDVETTQSQELPDPEGFIPTRPVNYEPTSPDAPDDVSSILSSPPSQLGQPIERDDPPSPSFGTHTLSTPIAQPMLREESSRVPSLLDVPRDVQAAAPSELETTGRRVFRPRQEKQLHPFMYEKAMHQQQFRQRGMRPVNVVFSKRTAHETQDGAFNDRENSARGQASPTASSVTQPSPSMVLGETQILMSEEGGSQAPKEADSHDVLGSDDDLPDLEEMLKGNAAGRALTGHKRRKTLHLPLNSAGRDNPRPKMTVNTVESQPAELSIPPSPPPTSSDSNKVSSSQPPSPKFRLPFGLNLARLPTPQVSSDLRPANARPDTDSESDSLPRQSRPSTALRRQAVVVTVESSAESSAGGTDISVESSKLQRERKRIKGVLPASWLKIDLRAQQRHASQSPTRRHILRTSSPPQILPQKGVAHRIHGRAVTTPRRMDDVISPDDNQSSDDAMSSHSVRTSHLPQARSAKDRVTQAPAGIEDDERMELDWVDPMLAGSSRHHKKRPHDRRRQPQIAEAFSRVQNARSDAAQGHNRSRKTAERTGQVKRSRNMPLNSREPTTVAPLLSIVDYSASPPTGGRMPQFVKVAKREARRHHNDGRHSPSNKVIRLATKRDTDDASELLFAWRNGSLSSRHVPEEREKRPVPGDGYEKADYVGHQDQVSRAPLAEIEDNRQGHLPSPFRHETRRHRSHIKYSSIGAVGRPRHCQTRLEPVLLSRNRIPRDEEPNEVSTPVHHRDDTARQYPTRWPHLQPRLVQYRGAQLETLETAFVLDHRAASFERRMQCLTENVASRSQRSKTQPVQLARFLEAQLDDVEEQNTLVDRQEHSSDVPATHTRPIVHSKLVQKFRKRRAQHVDVETRQFRQPSEALPGEFDALTPCNEPTETEGLALDGLGPFGTRYPTTFDIQPLAIGTFFPERTFIGSGDFAASLDFAGRDLDVPSGHIRVHISGDVLDWGVWTEEVAAGIARIPGAVSEALRTLLDLDTPAELDEYATVVESNIEHMLRSVVRYISRCLAFLDPVDRRSCIQNLQRFVADLIECITDQPQAKDRSRHLSTQVLLYAAVVANQTLQLARHPVVDSAVTLKCQAIVISTAHRLTFGLVSSGFSSLRALYEDNHHTAIREAGIKDDDWAASSFVILNHILRSPPPRGASFWSILSSSIGRDIHQMSSVSALDQVWYDIFTILPILEVSAYGVAQPGVRLQKTEDDFGIVRLLLERLFELYSSTTTRHASTVNDYIRASMTRCAHLITLWGWRRCESILNYVFDFFAQRSLAQLQNEESRGSTEFLDELDGQVLLEIQTHDSSFQIFLKILAVGLQGIRHQGTYNDKKIGGIAWRFVPNHGRTYRKDAEIKQTDIAALRNHYDLLCTLYYATPPGHRLRLELIRNLVDHSCSHREACRLGVRAWTRLASFQASVDEPIESLEAFIDWFRDIMQATSVQYRLARSEAEHDFAIAKTQGDRGLSEDLLNSTIASNQRQIAATLVDALAGVKRALEAARSMEIATYLIEHIKFWSVFTLFDASERRLYGALREGLGVFVAALAIGHKYRQTPASQQTSEESQEFGDCSALQEFAAGSGVSDLPMTIAEVISEPLAHLLSNVFGADTVLDESLLTRVIDVWVQVAQANVASGKYQWTHYLDTYSVVSWKQLRDTEQKAKYEPYFLARMIELMPSGGEVVRDDILISWLTSLVQREAMLKFQHTLTTALLNNWDHCPLLQNLPFSKDARLNRFDISMHDCRQRRLALLSSVLFNMWQDFDRALRDHPGHVQEKRSAYGSMLRQMMQAMKSNYVDLQAVHNASVADTTVHGAYVDFVQQVVSFLQQYTTDICRVDPFFLDSAAFPLPSNDPTYVVGRLKGYGAKLAESRTRKQLTMFVLSVSERAAADGQQEYLIKQLMDAASDGVERGDSNAPSLREVLITAIFPAYIEYSLSSVCSWLVACPILQACSGVVRNLLYSLDINRSESVEAVARMMSVLIRSVNGPLEHTILHPGVIKLPHTMRLLTCIVDACQSCLTVAEHLRRATSCAVDLTAALEHVKEIALAIRRLLLGGDDVQLPDTILAVSPPCTWPDTEAYTKQQVQDTFRNVWYGRNGQYFVKRGNASKEVAVLIGDHEEERDGLLISIACFCAGFERVFHGRDHGLGSRLLLDGDDFGIGSVMV